MIRRRADVPTFAKMPLSSRPCLRAFVLPVGALGNVPPCNSRIPSHSITRIRFNLSTLSSDFLTGSVARSGLERWFEHNVSVQRQDAFRNSPLSTMAGTQHDALH